MKAKELMIDDWVYNKNIDKPMQVYPVMFSQMFRTHPDATTEDYNIFPIPLTAGILEKNEWRCFNTYHSYSHPKAPFELRQQEDGGYAIEVDADEYGKAVFLFIHYVHELQHALRLCGIDKEIVL